MPESIDVERPSPARIYDYYLGGSHNFAVDRETARQVIAAIPDAPLIAQANRAFLHRVVRFLGAAGVRQFLDIGAGIPTAGNVHEIAPDATVVYVDVDPIAVAQGQAMVAGFGRAAAIEGDFRDPEAIFDNPEVRALLDLSAPVGVLVLAVLHFVPEVDDPAGIIARLRDRLAPGSYLALSQASGEALPPAQVAASAAIYRRAATPLSLRTRADFERLFDGFTLVEPGVEWVSRWRSDPAEEPAPTVILGGLGLVTEPAGARSARADSRPRTRSVSARSLGRFAPIDERADTERRARVVGGSGGAPTDERAETERRARVVGGRSGGAPIDERAETERRARVAGGGA